MFGQSIQNTVFRLCPPDYCRHRDNKALLIWKDIPHWMVVDEEVKGLLFSFENGAALRDVYASQPDLKSHSRQIERLVHDFSDKGILLSDANSHAPTPPEPEPNITAAAIENISWNLTHRCNLRCVYCYYSDCLSPVDNNELSAAEVVAFLKRIKPFAAKHITLTILGGEPLLYPHKLIAVCRAARTLGMSPQVSTNGTPIDADVARQARRIGLEVQVSLDGPSPAVNDPLRGEGTFDKIREGVSILRSHGVKTILNMVCCRQNFEFLEDFLKLALQWRVQEARFIPLKRMGGAQAHLLQGVSYYDIVTTAWRLLKEHAEYRALLGRDCLTILANTCRYADRKLSCGTGSRTLLLDADGVLYPCLNLNRPEFAFGCIRDNDFDFKEIWENAATVRQVRHAVNIRSAEKPCSSCPVRFWCQGGCRGETYANTGRLSAPGIHCDDLRKTILEIFWILSESPGIIKLY